MHPRRNLIAIASTASCFALTHCGPLPAATDASSADAHDVAMRADAADAPREDVSGDAPHLSDGSDAAALDAATDSADDAPTSCTGSDIWTCTADHSARTRCVGGALETDTCPHDGCTPRPSGTDDTCSTSCTDSASGTSMIWTCTSNHWQRQRCVSGVTQTEACESGCVGQPSGTNDFCAIDAPIPGEVSCAMIQWWNRPFSWNPGTYAISWGGYSHDNDLAVAASTPVQLRHASRLVEQSVHPWGWMPQFVDTVTGEHFAFLHLRPQSKFTTTVGRTYAAGTLVGYSGGDTTDTGYMVSNGSGSVYSTGAHLCVVTQNPFHTAFPAGMDACH
jgi:hypothetical protein